MTIWSWPSDSPPRVRTFRLRAFNISAVASQSQEYIPGGVLVQKFEAGLTMPPMESDQWRDLDGLVVALRGAEGKIRLWDAQRKEPYYNRTVTETSALWDGGASWGGGAAWSAGKLPPFVVVGETASRGTDNILLKGFPPSLSGVLRRGDLFEMRPNGIPADHGHLYEVTRWANSNSDGHVRVYFEAGLRKGLRTGDMCVIGGGGIYPSSVFRLASDAEGEMEVNEAGHGSLGLRFTEVLPIAA